MNKVFSLAAAATLMFVASSALAQGTGVNVEYRAERREVRRVDLVGANANPNRWRYRYHNNHWWYYTSQNRWLYWYNGNWQPYDLQTYYNYYPRGYNVNRGYYDGRYGAAYRGYGGYGYGDRGSYGNPTVDRRSDVNAGARVGANIGGAINGQRGASAGAAIGGAIDHNHGVNASHAGGHDRGAGAAGDHHGAKAGAGGNGATRGVK